MGTTGQEDIEQLKVRLKGASVLFVDDDHIARFTWGILFRKLGLLIDVVENGREALDMASTEDYDCIFTDFVMPEMDGSELIRRLRDNERTRITPIIVMSAWPNHEELLKLKNEGASDLIGKPCDIKQIVHMLAKWIPANGKPALEATPPVPPEPDTVVRTIPDTLPGIDMDKVRNRLDCDNAFAELYYQMLFIFRTDMRNKIDEIRFALSNNAINKARVFVHSLTNNAGAIMASALYDASKQLTEALKAEDAERISETLGLAEALHQEVLAGLEGLDLSADAAADSTSLKGVIDPSALAKAMAEAAEHMDQCCTEAEAALEKVRQELKGHASEELGKVAEAVSAFNYQAARLALRELAASLDPPLEV